MTRERHMFYRKDPASGKGHFFAAANWGPSCSLRKFDADTGALVDSDTKHGYDYPAGHIRYETAFDSELRGATRLSFSGHLSFARAEKDGGLPAWSLLELQRQVPRS